MIKKDTLFTLSYSSTPDYGCSNLMIALADIDLAVELEAAAESAQAEFDQLVAEFGNFAETADNLEVLKDNYANLVGGLDKFLHEKGLANYVAHQNHHIATNFGAASETVLEKFYKGRQMDTAGRYDNDSKRINFLSLENDHEQ